MPVCRVHPRAGGGAEIKQEYLDQMQGPSPAQAGRSSGDAKGDSTALSVGVAAEGRFPMKTAAEVIALPVR
jgi:hypothetical protein